MKVCVRPIPSTLSRAMHRVASALAEYAPRGVHLVGRPDEADLTVVHVIGEAGLEEHLQNDCAGRFALIQYCYRTAGGDPAYWRSVFQRARLVWSYYALESEAPRFYRAPLGVDPLVFRWSALPWSERKTAMSSGYSNGGAAEAISEFAEAALVAGLSVVHLGPEKVEGMTAVRDRKRWMAIGGCSDDGLSSYYGRARWVSGLRHVEGFELPAAEGLMCGARPVLFDRPEMRHWYGDSAVYVSETSGAPLRDVLIELFESRPDPPTYAERETAMRVFDWRAIARGFWERAL